MVDLEQLRQRSAIRLIHGNKEMDAILEYSEAQDSFQLVLPRTVANGNQPEARLMLTDWALELIELMPDGKLRLVY